MQFESPAQRTFALDAKRLTTNDKEKLEILNARFPDIHAISSSSNLFLSAEEAALIGSTVPCQAGYPTTPLALILFPHEGAFVAERRASLNTSDEKQGFRISPVKLSLFGVPKDERPNVDADIRVMLGHLDPSKGVTTLPELLSVTEHDGTTWDQVKIAQYKTFKPDLYRQQVATNVLAFPEEGIPQDKLKRMKQVAVEVASLFEKHYRPDTR